MELKIKLYAYNSFFKALECIYMDSIIYLQSIMRYVGERGCEVLHTIETDDLCGCISAATINVTSRGNLSGSRDLYIYIAVYRVTH